MDIAPAYSSILPRFPEVSPPTLGQIKTVLEITIDKAPGWDGLPAAAWKASGPSGCHLCLALTEWLMLGNRLPRMFHSSVVVYPPKKVGPLKPAWIASMETHGPSA